MTSERRLGESQDLPDLPQEYQVMVKFFCGVLLLIGNAIPTLGNPYFTPIELAQSAEIILTVRIVGAVVQAKPLRLEVAEVIKGEKPADTLTLDFSAALGSDEGEAEVHDLFDLVRANGSDPALVLLGKHNLLHINGKWARMNPGAHAKVWQFDKLDNMLCHTFSGGTDMLIETMRHLQKFPDTPGLMDVDGRVQWDTEEKIGELPGAATALVQVALDGGTLGLHAISPSGDRLWRQHDGAFIEDKQWSGKNRSAAWADFNGDGRVDCAALGEDHALRLYVQDASGHFSHLDIAVTEDLSEASTVSAIALPPGDMPSLVVGGSAKPLVLKNSGGRKPSFTAIPLPASEVAAYGLPGPCVVADFAGDGRADILQCFQKNGVLYRANADGTFTVDSGCGAAMGAVKSRQPCLGDFNGDGALDLYLAGGGATPIMLENEHGAFHDVSRLCGEPGYMLQMDATAIVAGDFNNDSFVDLFACYGCARSQAFFNRGFRTFALTEKLCFEVPEVDNRVAAAVWGDFDRDGCQDLAYALANGAVYLAKTTIGTMSQPKYIRVSLTPHRGCCGPLNVTFFRCGECIGVRQATLYGEPALLGVSQGGAYTVRWRLPNGETVDREVILSEKSPSADIIVGDE